MVALGFGAVQVGRSSNRSGRAVQRTSSGTSCANEATYSMRSRNAGSAQWMSSKTTTSGAVEPRSPRAACGHPRRSPRARRACPSMPSAASIRTAASSASLASLKRGTDVADLRRDLLERPVRDPLAVGEATPDEDARLRAPEQLAREARLPDPRRPDDRRELRRSGLRRPTASARLEQLELLLPADERRGDRARERRDTSSHAARAPERREPARSCPSASSGSTASARTRSRTRRSVAAPIRTSPAPAACSSRAATFTASPVASVSPVPATTSPVLTPMRTSRPRVDDGIPHLDRRTHRPQRVVLVHLRQTEDGHRRVADELLDRAAVTLEDRAQLGVVTSHDARVAPPDRCARRAPSSRRGRRRRQ